MQTLKEYQDIVKQPGKFESEPAYTPYFYDLMLDGDGEDVSKENDSPIIRFGLCDADVRMFPELAGFTHLELIISDSGFIYGYTCKIN